MAKLKMQDCSACGGSGKVPGPDAGEALRVEREKAGVSGGALAAAMGKSDTFIYDLERGNRNLTNELAELYQEKLQELAQ